MSLFPAYAPDDVASPGLEMQVEEASPALEARLLASEDEEEPPPAARAPAAAPTSTTSLDSFYLDHKSDNGNLRVSTLYYPGRPQYTWGDKSALGGDQGVSRGRKRRARRYFDGAGAGAGAGARAGAGSAADESAERVAAFRRMLADAPDDVDLWLKFIRFKERCVSVEAALETASQACERAPRSTALRHARLALARTQLPPDRYLTLLRDLIAAERSVVVRCELWSRLVWSLTGASAGVGAGGGAGAAQALCAALRDTRALPAAYPKLLYAYGSFLRAAGLWELLVLLVELVAAMSLPACAAFPPAACPARAAARDAELEAAEDEVARSGLPLPSRWVRVERARAAAHWRAPGGAGGAAGAAGAVGADPQRTPLGADLAAVLQPATAPAAARLLLLRLLHLAKVPLLPGTGYSMSWSGTGTWEPLGCGEALLPLVRAARRLPPAHPARPTPRPAAALLALLADPPHYFTDHHGYLSWVSSLWEACCEWAPAGAGRLAVLCWRLRFLHTLLLLLDTQEEAGRLEAQRIRKEARAALRAHAGPSPLPFVQFARIELVVSGMDAAKAVALHAAKAALRDPSCPDAYKLYTARALTEIAGLDDPISIWLLVCAVLGERLPSDEHLAKLPPEELLEAALEKCEAKCAEFEEQYCRSGGEEEEEGEAGWEALLPAEGEWGGARALLACPRRRHQLFLSAAQAPPRADLRPAAARYWEQAACALVWSARAHHSAAAYARLLAPHHPHNAYLAVAGSGAPLWSLRNASDATDAHTCLRETEVGALAEILPPLLRAVEEWRGGGAAGGGAAGGGAAGGGAARRAARVCRRVARAGGGGAVAWAALLEAAARADCPHTQPLHALYAALDDCPQHKWLYVRGAAWCAGEGGALADLLLHRQLRLHALPDELPDTAPRKPAAAAPAPAPAAAPAPAPAAAPAPAPAAAPAPAPAYVLD